MPKDHGNVTIYCDIGLQKNVGNQNNNLQLPETRMITTKPVLRKSTSGLFCPLHKNFEIGASVKV